MKAVALISTFLDAQSAELDASENTQLAYARDLKYLLKLTKPGQLFVEAWEHGDQRAAVVSNSDIQ